MKNKLIDLNNHLFLQLERLSDESLGDELLRQEVSRTKAIVSVAAHIIGSGHLALEAQKAIQDGSAVPQILRLEDKTA